MNNKIKCRECCEIREFGVKKIEASIITPTKCVELVADNVCTDCVLNIFLSYK